MTGLSGLLLTSSTGAKGRWTPTARASVAVTRPISWARRSSPVAPTAINDGNRVAPPNSMLLGRKTAPRMRKPAPLSRSAPTSSGYLASDCRLLILAATSEGEPTETITPPTPSSRTASAMRSKPSDPSGAKSPSIQGMSSWPAFSSRVIDARTEDAHAPGSSEEDRAPGLAASSERCAAPVGVGRPTAWGTTPTDGTVPGSGPSVGGGVSAGAPSREPTEAQESVAPAMSARTKARPAVRRGVARLEPDVARLFSASTG